MYNQIKNLQKRKARIERKIENLTAQTNAEQLAIAEFEDKIAQINCEYKKIESDFKKQVGRVAGLLKALIEKSNPITLEIGQWSGCMGQMWISPETVSIKISYFNLETPHGEEICLPKLEPSQLYSWKTLKAFTEKLAAIKVEDISAAILESINHGFGYSAKIK